MTYHRIWSHLAQNLCVHWAHPAYLGQMLEKGGGSVVGSSPDGLMPIHSNCIYILKNSEIWGICKGYAGRWYACRNVDFKAVQLQICMGCHQKGWHHQKVNRMCNILVWAPSPLSLLLRRYRWLNFTQIYILHNYSQLLSLIIPNLFGVSPTMWDDLKVHGKGLILVYVLLQ